MADQKRPNILVIWGDDIRWQNVSAYGMGKPPGYGSIPINASDPKMHSASHVSDPPVSLLGTPPRAVAVGREVDLHHGERLRRIGRGV